MKTLVKNKKIDARILTAVLYLSFCAAGYLTFRGTFAMLLGNIGVSGVGLSNYIVAFFVAGLIPAVLYECISRFIFRFSQARVGGNTDSLMYALRFFYIGANLVIFLVKLVYLWHPIAHIYGDIVIDFVVTTLAFAAFLYYAVRHVPKERVAPLLYQLGGSYIIVYGFISLLTLLLEVL